MSAEGTAAVGAGLRELIWSLAAQEAKAAGFGMVAPVHLLMALGKLAEAVPASEPDGGAIAGLRAEFGNFGIEPCPFRRRLRALVNRTAHPAPGDGVVRRSDGVKEIFDLAVLLAQKDNARPDPRYLLRAAMASLACGSSAATETKIRPAAPAAPLAQRQSLSLGELTRRMRALRQALLDRIHGQDHAVHQFVEGLFNVEVLGGADTRRKRPAGLFLFAGPPGVGKTFLAECGAEWLGRPFLRLDMSSYGVASEFDSLVGTPPVFRGAKPGILTGFVSRNPNALLLFDEIEKACSSVIHLFLQILDAGRLQDKHTEEEVPFRDTVLIFTTNVGKSLYDNQNASGVQRANSGLERAAILDALRTEVDPRRQTPYFPEAICSRMATGYPLMFNHLRVGDLALIATAELRRVAGLLEQSHGQRCEFAPEIPLALVMREGAATDARTVRARAEAFLKEEIYGVCRLFSDERLDESVAAIHEISVELDRQHAGDAAAAVFGETVTPRVLFAGGELSGRLYAEALAGRVEWRMASTADQVLDLLARETVDLVLLDLTMGRAEAGAESGVATLVAFDYAPGAARWFAEGQKVLERLRTRMPEVPVYLFNPAGGGGGVDRELLLACMRAGGARGVVETTLVAAPGRNPLSQRDVFVSEMEALARRLRQERTAAELGARSQVLAFDTAPALEGPRLRIRCRNLRLTRAVRGTDASGLVSDIERPATLFDDVIGGGTAKEALTFLRDWLKDPRKYAAAGIAVPRGVLLTGPPGTGKTMLARALAGESNCAFLTEAASNLTGKYVGSGPENVRKLFERARRYAPAIVFIDEIDAVGVNRSEVRPGHVGHAEAMTLNQLLTEMDGFSKNPALAVIVVAATNHEEKLDAALKRRFGRVIEVELPTSAERLRYLRVRLAAKEAHTVSGAVLERIALQSAGRSIADLERVLAEAAVMALGAGGVVSDATLSEAFEKVLLGAARTNPDPLRTARHEAGHALAMYEQGSPPVYVTIVGRGNAGGYAAYGDTGDHGTLTKPEMEARIRALLAGREAERLYYGPEEGDSTGPSNDLERATGIAEAMVYELGMSEAAGPVRIDRRRPLPAETGERCHRAVREIVEQQGARVREMLERRRGALDRVVVALVERNRLVQSEVVALIEGGA